MLDYLLNSGYQYTHTELKNYVDPSNSKSIVIDKLPLNLTQAPLIRQLYPNARYILALRHPLDTILSCWMQNFRLNAAMANMVDLDRVVELYCTAMENFQICRNIYDLNVHEIRYEDLVNGFEQQARSVLQFLTLRWEPELKNYQSTALQRGRIDTPSYHQVIQPIYKEAQHRWPKYYHYLNKYLDTVEP